MIDLRLGRWQDVLQDVEQVDAVITDPPYSERTHDGHFSGCADPEKPDGWAARTGHDDKRKRRRAIRYAAWTSDDVKHFISHWSALCSGWIVGLTDHILIPAWETAATNAGRYVFAPLPFFEPGKCPRLTGDGPASWTTQLMVSRPKTRAAASWGSLDGGYVLPRGQGEQKAIVGGKPLWLMRALVRDYTRPDDLICDPCAGSATTLIAAAIEGRRAVGAECDPETYAKAKRRIEAGYTPLLPFKEAL